MNVYLSIFYAFLKVGLFGFGGGPALIPLIEKEVVSNYGWLSTEEFIDSLAMANSLPGPVATKISLCIGLRVAGPAGAAIALGAILLPSSLLIIVLTGLYYKYRNIPSIRGVLQGIRPVVIALLMVTVAHLAPKSVMTWDSFLIALVAFAAVFYFKVHPIITIVCAGLIGLWFYR